MRLYNLSGYPSRPCYVIKYASATIMLDCGLDVSTLSHFLPLLLVSSGRLSQLPGWAGNITNKIPGFSKLQEELKESDGKVFIDAEPEFLIPEIGMLDMAMIDIILISNFHCMLALPYITEYTNFSGVIYATEPTLHIGRLFMEELVQYIQRVPKLRKATAWKEPEIMRLLPSPLRDAVSVKSWRKCYNQFAINSCLSKIEVLAFNEGKDIPGGLQIKAISSGYCIGSSNWLIQSSNHKFAYLGGSSTLTTHPKPMEQSPLKSCDVLIMSSLTQTPTANPDTMIGEFCVNTAMTLKNGGNVLVPCSPAGVIYDLLECLSGHLDSSGLGQVPMYFISPVADSSLAYSNIYAEWLSTAKQSKIYLPDPPFPHAELIKNNRLKHYPTIYDGFSKEVRLPCVVFTGHPSLRFGDAVHFMQLWSSSAANTIIFTEPDFSYLEALSPYQPINMKVCYCPIDTTLSFSQANKLIRDISPKHLVIPEQYTVPPLSFPQRPDLTIDSDLNAIVVRKMDVVKLPIKRKYQQIDITPELANSLVPTEVQPGVGIATLTGSLTCRDFRYTLKPLSTNEASKRTAKDLGPRMAKTTPAYVYGALDVMEFVRRLKQQNIIGKLEDSGNGNFIIALQNEDSLIQIEAGSTHVICNGNEPLRIRIRDTLLQCLSRLP